MKSLAIIGTAGRRGDGERLNVAVFDVMTDIAYDVIRETGITHLVSGGAAWADHVAVRLVLEGVIPAENLMIFLPSALNSDGFASSRDGNTSNYYHRKFSHTARIDSIAELNEVRRRGANLIVNPAGFFARNAQVAASADVLLAFTFGEGPAWTKQLSAATTSAREAGLKDGGTAHTFDRCRAAVKIHVPLGSVDLAAQIEKRAPADRIAALNARLQAVEDELKTERAMHAVTVGERDALECALGRDVAAQVYLLNQCVSALTPFATYRDWARRNEWPADIANDPGTPICGREDFDEDTGAVALRVADFDAAGAAVMKAAEILKAGEKPKPEDGPCP